MAQGVQHRIILVGVDSTLRGALSTVLESRAAQPTMTCPDLSSACREARAHPEQAHLFIVQLADRDSASHLSSLTGALPGQPVLVLLPPGADLASVVGAQRAGAAQVVPLPLQPEDFLRALDCIGLQFAPPVRQARLIAVCGVSGGCGATTLALNLAQEIADRNPPGTPGCLLIELARQMGTLATYLDIEPATTSHDLLGDVARLTPQGVRQALTHVAPGLDVLTGPYREITPGGASVRAVSQLIEYARRLAAVVVLDVPCTFDDHLFQTLALADEVVLVGAQSVSSVRTLKMFRDLLLREEGIQALRVVINRYEPALPGFDARRLAELLRVPRLVTVANDFPSILAAANRGKPLRQAAPQSPVLADVAALAADLLGAPPPARSTASPDQLERALQRVGGGPRPLRVLHIEDDEVQHDVLRMHLGRLKDYRCGVTACTNEADGVDLFGRQGFDLVVLDYHLAQGNGMSCLKRLRAVDPLVPILVVSALTEPQVAAELLEAGADDFLSKENLAGERLGRALAAALARADALRARLPQPAEGAELPLDQRELLGLLGQVHQAARSVRYGVARIQRLADLVADELEKGSPGREVPRKALLALFLRLFGDG